MKLSRTTSQALDDLIDKLDTSGEVTESVTLPNSEDFGSMVVRGDDKIQTEGDNESYGMALNHKEATWEKKLGALMIGEKRSTPSNKQRSPLPKFIEPSLISVDFGRGRENLSKINFDALSSITPSDLAQLNNIVKKVSVPSVGQGKLSIEVPKGQISAAEQKQLDAEKAIKDKFGFWEEKVKKASEMPSKTEPSNYKPTGKVASRWIQNVQKPSETTVENPPSIPKANGKIASRWLNREEQKLSQPSHLVRQEARRKLDRDVSIWERK